MNAAEILGAADILAAAARRIEEVGWCQGQMETSEGVCMAGAVHWAVFGDAWKDGLTFEMDRAYRALERECQGDFVKWNDDMRRCRHEVVAALRNAKRWL